ncbi:hypothetical protein GCM10009087_01810 [Sphingomonas oligophenolica]|uniref:Uncharacterized protein n=1 Tax=Sphingomonas oligophenolica TaxID=301154 RepID=A0ABU9Y0Z4_9SPHN
MIRAALGVVAAIVAMAVVIFIAVKIPERTWAPAIGMVLACFAGGYAGTFVGRTQWSGWIAVGLLVALLAFGVFYFVYLRQGSLRGVVLWRVVGVPTAMLVACWCGTLLASKAIPVIEEVDLEDLHRAFE